MRNEFTLTEMTEMNLPMFKNDPIYEKQIASFCMTNQKLHRLLHLKPKTKENFEPLTVKNLPSTHYLESRFSAYSHAKVYNKPLFSEISKNTEELSDKSLSVSRFRSSRYPKVPLTRELSEKVQQINTFREISNWGHKKENMPKPSMNLSVANKGMKPNMILLNLKSWDKVKKENLRTMRTVGPNVLRDNNQMREMSLRKRRSKKGESIGKNEAYENFGYVDTCDSGASFYEFCDRNRSVQRSGH